MKKYFCAILSILLTLNLSLFFSCSAFAAKTKKQKQKKSIKVATTEGTNEIFGSVLNPNKNQVLLFLPKSLLNAIRRAGSAKVPIQLASSTDSTRTYAVPDDSVTIQKKKINGKMQQVAVVNISNLTSQAGVTVTPGSLQSGNYKLRITGKMIEESTDVFNYQTPVLVVGNVKSDNTKGFVTVEDLAGDMLSDNSVAINIGGSFLTEVRGNKINKKNTKAKSRLVHFQTANNFADTTSATNSFADTTSANNSFADTTSATNSFADTTSANNSFADTTSAANSFADTTGEDLSVGLVHAVTDKDLYSIIPLDNNAENNAAKAAKPTTVDESTTLTANLAKEDEDLALELAQDELDKLISEEDIPEEEFKDFGCAIDQFSNRCTSLTDKELLASIGADFKKFVSTADCNFPDFKIIKKFALNTPDNENAILGKAYCENTSDLEEDSNKPCETYSDILSQFEDGFLFDLPCPPDFCTEFKDIIDCSASVNFCRANEPITPFRFQVKNCSGPNCRPQAPACVAKPTKDLYCAKIGVNIKEIDCTSTGRNSPGFIVETNSKGNKFCVPKEVPPDPFDFSGKVKTSKDIAEDCEISACHKECEKKFGFNPPPSFGPAPGQQCPSCDCNFACEAEAGRVADCGNPKSMFFAKSCCNTGGDFGSFGGNFGDPFGGSFGSSFPFFRLANQSQLPPPPDGSFGGTFGQPPPSGTFGQPPPGGTFGQPPPGGTFGQPPPSGTFGQPSGGDPFGGSFGQPSSGDPFGGSFGQPSGGDPFGGGSFGQPSGGDPFGGGSFGQPSGGDPFGSSFGQPSGGFGNEKGPIQQDVRECLCGNDNNFNSNGLVKEESLNACKNSCPQGYEKDPKSESCLPICEQGSTRDAGGVCRKQCSQGQQLKDGKCQPIPTAPKPSSSPFPSGGQPFPSSSPFPSSGQPFPSPSPTSSPLPTKVCAPGEESSPTNPCKCAPGASSQIFGNFSTACECPTGQTYTITGCTSSVK